MQVNFVFLDKEGKTEQSHNVKRDLSEAAVMALLNADEIMYAKNHGSGSKSSCIVEVVSKQFDVYDETPKLTVVVKEQVRNGFAFG